LKKGEKSGIIVMEFFRPATSKDNLMMALKVLKATKQLNLDGALS
jgi:hypothetical protein